MYVEQCDNVTCDYSTTTGLTACTIMHAYAFTPFHVFYVRIRRRAPARTSASNQNSPLQKITCGIVNNISDNSLIHRNDILVLCVFLSHTKSKIVSLATGIDQKANGQRFWQVRRQSTRAYHQIVVEKTTVRGQQGHLFLSSLHNIWMAVADWNRNRIVSFQKLNYIAHRRSEGLLLKKTWDKKFLLISFKIGNTYHVQRYLCNLGNDYSSRRTYIVLRPSRFSMDSICKTACMIVCN